MRGKFPLTVVVCLFLVSIVEAQNFLTVNESETQMILQATAAQTSLVIENSRPSFDGQISLELVDTNGAVRARTQRKERFKSGKATYQVDLPLHDLMQKNSDEIGWFRLRFRVADAGGNLRSDGVISLSEIIKDAFELRVTASENVRSGMNYRARIRAFQPFTNEPVKNVKIKGELELELDADDDEKTEKEEDKLKISAKGETNAEGFAVLDFKIPPGAKLDDESELKITGAKYGIVREIEEDLEIAGENVAVYLNADKPLYQPGQTFNLRGIAIKTGNSENSVVAGAEFEFVIKDEEDTVLYRETVKTSRFGVASISWQIPENAKLGIYRVEVEDADGEGAAYENFKVSRYDLPNFTVSAKADRNFYLSEQTTASVEVRADYLFGKPVAKGKVRVVEETERKWNYREQKYDIEEAETFEGETDADGKFTTQISLIKRRAELRNQGYRRYADLNFAAYFTDATTNRTEQRRFDLRLTKEAIHVRLIGETYRRNPNLPLVFYVSTFYADGSPARCAVELKGKYENELGAGKPIALIQTNQYGAGKLEFVAPPNGTFGQDLQLEIIAADEQGQTGTHEEEIDFSQDEGLEIRADKTIYKAGEAIRAEIFSTKKDALVYVDVAKDWSVVDSRIVRLKNGRGEIKIPYQAAFKGDLVVAAYTETVGGEEGEVRLVTAARGVIYPAPQNLKLNAEFSQTIYRPNEEARINFSVLTPDQTPLESALGIIVFDKAIEERARTDAEFGGSVNLFENYGDLLGYGSAFGSLSRRDIDELNPSKPVSNDLQLAAEIMLHGSDYYPRIYESDNFTQARGVFTDYFEKQLAPVEENLKKQYNADYKHPTSDDSLRAILAKKAIDFERLRDPWDVNYRTKFEVEKADDLMTLTTAGADKKFDTKDDFTVLRMSFNYFLPAGQAIDRAVLSRHRRTNSFIRDYAALRDELKSQAINLDDLRDRWNREY